MPVTTINPTPVNLPIQTVTQGATLNFPLIFFGLFFICILVIIFAIAGYFALITYKNREREERSLKSILLEVAVPQANDIKVDAMEQMFGALNSIKKGGWKQKYDIQPVISFEIVARPEDIRFYVWCPRKLVDLVEKQIHGAYPDASIS